MIEDYRQHTFILGLASVSGIFAIVDGIFFNVHRYGIDKDLLLFGVVGLLVRERQRKGIHDKHPLMQSDLQHHGMTSSLICQ